MASAPEGGETLQSSNRALITICLMIATLMQSLDSTIANVALPYMQGSLSASYDQITWVLTSYVVMAAVMTAPVGWLSVRFGRKNLLIVCLIGFTITSMMCGVATSLTEMVADRALQGAFGAALVPLSQSTLLDIYPAKTRGMAMSIWGMGVMLGPILGPTLGGYLTDDFNWRYVFFVNLPFGIIAVLGLLAFMPTRKNRGALTHFDWLGFAVLSIGLLSLQLALDRGEEKDWLGSTEIVAYLLVAGAGFYLFTVHMFTGRNTLFPRSIFRDRNFNAGLITMFIVGLVLLASSALLAPYLENLGNYPVATAGLVMAPRGFGTMAAMLIGGRLINRIDPRWLLATGYILLMYSFHMQEEWLPSEPQLSIITALIIQGAGMGFVFMPLQVVAFYTVTADMRTQGSSMLSLSRNVGSAIGTSIMTALLDHETQYEHANLAGYITPFFRPLQAGGAVSRMLDPHTAAGAGMLNSMINIQAQIIGYIDDYKFMLIITIPAMACLLLMHRPGQGAAPGGASDGHAVMD